MKNEINDKELENVTGGALTVKASDWLDRNKDVIIRRLNDYYASQNMNAFEILRTVDKILKELTSDNTPIINKEAAKAYFKNIGANCDDLD